MKGLPIKPRAVSTPPPVIDLMAALKRSLARETPANGGRNNKESRAKALPDRRQPAESDRRGWISLRSGHHRNEIRYPDRKARATSADSAFGRDEDKRAGAGIQHQQRAEAARRQGERAITGDPTDRIRTKRRKKATELTAGPAAREDHQWVATLEPLAGKGDAAGLVNSNGSHHWSPRLEARAMDSVRIALIAS
jgi:hypothetical protein